MTPLTALVVQRIDELFPPQDQEAVRRLLEERCGADLPLTTHMGPEAAGFDRIRLAVLKLSQGNLKSLEREIEDAHRDWRDTLMAAGFGQDLQAHLKWNPPARSKS